VVAYAAKRSFNGDDGRDRKLLPSSRSQGCHLEVAAIASAPTLEVQSLMNESPMNSRRWGVVALCFTIALLDGFDTQAADMTWVITTSTVGMAIGAMSLGSLGDKIGRKKAVMLALAFFRRLLADRSACDIRGPDSLAAVPDWAGHGCRNPLVAGCSNELPVEPFPKTPSSVPRRAARPQSAGR
jgi:hypothetical protein